MRIKLLGQDALRFASSWRTGFSVDWRREKAELTVFGDFETQVSGMDKNQPYAFSQDNEKVNLKELPGNTKSRTRRPVVGCLR